MERDLAFDVHEDIRRALTLPGSFYTDPAVFEAVKERIFARSWQFVADTDAVKTPGQAHPLTLLEGCLDEPLLLTRDAGGSLHCLSNVCTHRANIVCEEPGNVKHLRCRYHGRRFGLDGSFQSMPEFEGVADFPSESDNLAKLPFEVWGKFLFASLAPGISFEELIRPMRDRVGWLPLDSFVFDPSRSKEYEVRANWALYCDNYLEGFHIPFVHSGLAQCLDYSSYGIELHPYSSLQIGVAKPGQVAFELPADSPDHGRQIAAYYFWLFPNTMFNFYPWGLSINVVKPLAVGHTRVSYASYVWDASKLEQGAGALLDRVELEDEAIVEAVQKGARSRFYTRGRYSPAREQGVHHFHRLLTRFIA